MAAETGIPAAVEDIWWSAVSMVNGTGCNLGGKHPTLNAERPTSTGVSTDVIPVSSLDAERQVLDVLQLNTQLVELIRQTIRAQGPQSFAWFMQQALYHPEHGYYASGACAIGRAGDYFTNVSVGPTFGQLLAAQFLEVWEQLNKIDDFTIVEQGAHDGQFARDVLEFTQKCAPEFFATLRYRIVEPFPRLQPRQCQTLQAFQRKVEWCDALQTFSGVHFSNELLDAMPVRLITDGRERLVGLNGDKFVFVEQPLHKPIFNQAAMGWVDEVAANLQRGYVIIIDYGCPDAGCGNRVQVRSRHRNLDSPFEQIGDADITMSVDWNSIAHRAKANGLRVAGFTDQHHFLSGIISGLDCGDSAKALMPLASKAKRQLQTLLHPEMLGRAFQVLGLTKNIDSGVQPLSGFKFAIALRSGAGR
jgi:SAM-dependent MidA family methyltransferase